MTASTTDSSRPAPGPGRPALLRLLHRGRSAGGAVVAQLAQALASLLLQVVALRALGAEGLGVFALLYSGLVLLTAVTSGLVGDSLTVLDRGQQRLRAGLQVVTLVVVTGSAVVAGVLVWAAELLGAAGAVLLSAAVGVFLLEDLGRRWLMACLRFWSVVVVDLTCLAVSVAWLLGASVVGGSLRLVDLVATLLVAQAAGLVVAVLLLPRSERRWVRGRGADVRSVLSFGLWRAAQQGVRPATLTSTRALVVVVLGAAMFGELEAARVYTAPAMLVLNGAAGFLFASYAARGGRPLRTMLRAADTGAGVLLAASVVFGAVAVVLAPSVGDFLTGGAFPLEEVAVVGWCLYAAAGSVLLPYASLAAVRGRHALVLGLRLVELAVSVAGVSVVLLVLEAGAAWVPFALALGTAACAVVVRQRVLVPQAGRGVQQGATP